MATGYGIVSATSVMVGQLFHTSDTRYARVAAGNKLNSPTKFGKRGRDVFDDRAACVAAVDKKLAKKAASLRKQLAAIEKLTGEAVVAAAEYMAKACE